MFSFLARIWDQYQDVSSNERPNVSPRTILSQEEKTELMALARHNMHAVLYHEDPVTYEGSNPHLNEISTVDVVIWIGGRLRGSYVVADKPLHEGVAAAAQLTVRDSRFKPISREELGSSLIEISIIRDPVSRFSRKSIGESFLDGQKGYSVSFGGRREWYFPATFNVRRFENLRDLTTRLAEKKAQILALDTHRATFSTYHTEGFIESLKRGIADLDGPVMKQANLHESEMLLEELRTYSDRSARWLLQLQDADGYIRQYVDPVTQTMGKMDWIRLAHAAYALAEYGRVTDRAYITASEKAFSFTFAHLTSSELDEYTKLLTLIYLGKAALCLGKDTQLDEIISSIEGPVQKASSYEPILYANLASFFSMVYERGKAETLQAAVAAAEQVFVDFSRIQQAGAPTGLALYSELVPAYTLLHAVTGEGVYLEKANQVAGWLIGLQLASGAFPAGTNSTFMYTRGTAKIFEALASQGVRQKESLTRALGWLVEMQYSEENTYFVPSEFKKHIIGGFRHDHANPEAWIDAAAHLLIGAARILATK